MKVRDNTINANPANNSIPSRSEDPESINKIAVNTAKANSMTEIVLLLASLLSASAILKYFKPIKGQASALKLTNPLVEDEFA